MEVVMPIHPDFPVPNEPIRSTPADPTASGQLSKLPPELQAKIFEDLSKKDTVTAQVDRQSREIATDKTRREETAAMKKVVAELKQHVVNALEPSIPQSSDDPKSAEVTRLALEICADLDKIVSSNPIIDSQTVSQIRDNINAKKEALVNSLSKLSKEQLNSIKHDLEADNKFTGIMKNVVESAIKNIQLIKLQSNAGSLTSWPEGVRFINTYVKVDPEFEKAIEFCEKHIKNEVAKEAFYNQLAFAMYENQDHAKLFNVMLVQDFQHQVNSINLLRDLIEEKPELKAEYIQKLTELAAKNPAMQRLINAFNS